MMYNIDDYHIRLDKLGKIIIYLRKSREDMIDGRYLSDEETLARHEERLQQWAERNLGHRIPDDCIYKEVGSGEKIKTRPVFQEVLHQLEVDPSIDGVLTLNCSRLSRGDMVDCGTIVRIFEYTNTLVLTEQRNYNLKNRYDKRFFQDELRRGSDYLEQARELLENGRHFSCSIGKFVVSKAPYGYDKVTCKEMKVSDGKGFTLRPNEDAETVKFIFDKVLEGYGVIRIANMLNDMGIVSSTKQQWTRTIVYNILVNEVYKGYITWGRKPTKKKIIDGEEVMYREKVDNYPVYKGLHKAIIPEETFDKVQELMSNRMTTPIKKDLFIHNPLASICKCSVCGKQMKRFSSSRSVLKRKQELDKEELNAFLRKHKEKAKLTNSQLAELVGVSKTRIQSWFRPNLEKVNYTKFFDDHWIDIKKALNIGSTKWDKVLFEYEEVKNPDLISCDTSIRCNNRGALLYVVEEMILKEIKNRYDSFNYYLDNYESEVKKETSSNKKALKNIDTKIEQLNKQLKNAKIAYEQEVDTLEEYIDRKREITNEIEIYEERRSNLINTDDKEEQLIVIKKQIPVLKLVLDDYYKLTFEDRNLLLKSIIKTIYYKRNYITLSGTTLEDKINAISLEIEWLD